MRVRTGFATMTAVALVLGGCGWFGRSHEPGIAAGPAVIHAPFACPAIGPNYVATPGAEDLPTGALAARFCSTDELADWMPPRDDLIGNVDALVRLVDKQRITGVARPGPRVPGNVGCGGPSQPSFAIVFRYEDGIRTISGNPMPCKGLALQVGNGVRAHPMRAWHAYFRLLATQRRHESSPEATLRPAPTACTAFHGRHAFTPLFDARRMTDARACRLRPNGSPLVGTTVTLSTRDLSVLRGDLATQEQRDRTRSSHPRCLTGAIDRYLVVAHDVWGDRTVLYGHCNLYSPMTAIASFEPSTFRALSATLRLLARLLKG
jgi:hypothetical protein